MQSRPALLREPHRRHLSHSTLRAYRQNSQFQHIVSVSQQIPPQGRVPFDVLPDHSGGAERIRSACSSLETECEARSAWRSILPRVSG